MKKVLILCIILIFHISGFAQTPLFEGIITFRSYESNSKSVIKWSAGQAFNGSRTFEIATKGNKVARYDLSLGMKTVFDPDEETVTVIFDELKRAVIFDFDAYVSLYSTFSRTPYQTKASDSTKIIQGYKCRKMEFDLHPENGTGHIEAWVCEDFNIYKNYWNAALYGVEIPGILMKYTWDTHTSAPLVGNLSSYVAAEITSIENSISDDYFKIPSHYMTFYSLPADDTPYSAIISASKLRKHLKDNYQTLKKAKKDPSQKIDETIRFHTDEEWDF